MKKLYACIVILMAGVVSLWADLPPRMVEIGFNTGTGFGNTYIGLSKIFKKIIEIDLTQEPKTLEFDFGADFNFFVNFNLLDTMGFGLFVDADAQGQVSLSEDILKFLQRNELDKTYEGDIGIGAAAFMEAGAHGYFHVKKLRIALRPAYYLPVVYMKPNAHYTFRTGSAGDIYVDFEYDLALYTAFEIGESEGDLGSLGSIISSIKLDPSKISGFGGLDLTMGVDYSILPQLTLGAVITHIPLFPAQLTNKAVIRGGKRLDSADLIGDLIDDGKLENLLQDKTVDSSYGDIQIFRPFKFGINTVYTPFKFEVFSLSLIPQIGYAYNAIYLKPHSLEGSITLRAGLVNIMRQNSLVAFTFRSGYGDKLWKHGLGLTLNFRAMQIDIGAAIQSEDFVMSFVDPCLNVNVGLCFGW
jgi:hypothetical protein